MDKIRITYIDLIKAIQSEETIKLIGEVDLKLLNSQTVESLYYSFPLIERLVLEIYKLIPDADIEQYNQGIMRPIVSIIDGNSDNILPENIVKIIKKYFDDDGARNQLFHNKVGVINMKVSFDEINFAIMQLLSILKSKISENSDFNFENIEYFEIN